MTISPASRPSLRAFVSIGSLLCLLLAAVPGRAAAADLTSQQVVAGLHAATLEATIDPEGTETICTAQYVAEEAFEAEGWVGARSAPCSPTSLGSGTGPVATRVSLGGLSLHTRYHYRFLVESAGGTTQGPEGSFSTFGIESFSFKTLDREGHPMTQAGGTPDELLVELRAPVTLVQGLVQGVPMETASPTGTIKDVLTELPPGLIGNPTATPRCSVRAAEENKCSGDAQVGVLSVMQPGRVLPSVAPLYNTLPPEGDAARFAGQINGSTDAFIDSSVRTGADYGITSGGFDISGRANIYAITVRLWGVPSSSSHDAERFCPIPGGRVEGCSSGIPERPFLRNPTSCVGPLDARARMDAYQGPGEYDEASAVLPAITGCEAVGFEPSLEVKPTTTVAASPTGLHVDLHVPQDEDPEGLATADLRDAVVTLPPGLTVNPSSANGLGACSPTQFGLTTPVGTSPIHTTPGPAECPDAAKIGTVEIDTPLLDHPVPGAVYLAQPYQNPFESLLAIYIAAYDPVSGVVVKLAGKVDIGAEGQLTTTFEETPQLPFEDFKLDFFSGAGAPLKTQALCGSYRTTSSLTPWSAPASGPPATPGSRSSVDSAPAAGPCPTSAGAEPTAVGFEAGSESPLAGAFSPFILHLSRPDGSQDLSSLSVTPPPGLLGRLAGIPYCPDAALTAAAAKSGEEEQAAPSCPSSSQIGDVVVGAGAGPKPYYVGGKVYLTGPYKGAPLSLAIVTPAVAGPFDLGDVVVRAALRVNPQTTQITVQSDPIPAELKGIPLDVRSIAVKMDRPDFTLNPTSCEAMAVAGSAITAQGVTVPLSDRFQAGSCASLPFKPKLALRVFGKTNRNSKPRLRAVLRTRRGEANIRRAQVNLPHSLFLEQAHIKAVCTRVQWTEGDGNGSACPKGSIYGHARAFSPLLDHPVEGPVYLRSSSHKLPDMVAALNGQISVELDGKVDSGANKGLRNTFELVPDAPVSKFILELQGGAKGLLVNSESLCSKVGRNRRAIIRLVGQNGKVHQFKPHVTASCRSRAGAGHRR